MPVIDAPAANVAPPREEYFDNSPTGVEVEDNEPNETEPWDPSKIRVHTDHYSLRHVVDMITDNDIDLAPDFQRQSVWKPPQRSKLIESLLLGIPLPSFYFNQDSKGRLQVVDGVQRLSAIYDYVANSKFKLNQLIYLKECEGHQFDELPSSLRRRLNASQFVAHVIDPQTPYQVKFDIFRRINTGGTPLSQQEIRHCMSNDKSRKFLKELVSHEEFDHATGGALRRHPRMADREVALRFAAFRMFSLDEYAELGSFEKFLEAATAKLDSSSEEDRKRIRNDFVRGMTNGHAVFGEHAFRKRPTVEGRKNPINRALFESWGTVLADYNESAVEAAAKRICKLAAHMMTSDEEFIKSISTSTADIKNVRARFNKVRKLVQEVIP